MKVLEYPLTRITISFVAGILFSYYWTLPLYYLIPAAITTTAVFILYFYNNKRNSRTAPNNFGIFIILLSFLIGMLTLLFHTESLQESNYIHNAKAFAEKQSITLTIREKLKPSAFNDRYIALVSSIQDKTYSGKILLNVRKDSLAPPLIIGNIIQLQTTLRHNPIPRNPNQFDYVDYLKNKQIFAQIHAEASTVSVSQALKKDLWYYSGKLHSRILANLRKANFRETEMNVALALILGQRQEISADIVQDYQFSGATHILSVSGLHVGFIMMFVSFVLQPVPNTRSGSFFKLIAVLISLAIFAIISGLSPPVLRSVVMFSFLAIGNHLVRRVNTYHTLIVSIFLILLAEPYFLFDVGFQLSYLALFFIIWLQPLADKVGNPRNKILSYIWKIILVSFAAQIGTLPLCLYYFHQFPGLFFVTNVLIIPTLSFIMLCGILVMAAAVFFEPPLFLIQIFEYSIYILNKSIHFIASLESFVIRDISFNFYYLIALYLFIISVIIWIKRPSYSKLIFALCATILVQFSFIVTKIDTQSSRESIIYSIKNKTLLSERNGRNITFYHKAELSDDTNQFVTNPYAVGNFANTITREKFDNLLFINGKKISIIDSSCIYPRRISPDILLLINSPKINLERLIKEISPHQVIADGSNSYSMIQVWKKTCLHYKIPFHSTSEMGFYKIQ